jgi:hypothetical protein
MDLYDVDDLLEQAVRDKGSGQMKMYSDAIYDLRQSVGTYLDVNYGKKRIGDLSLEELNDMECEALITRC